MFLRSLSLLGFKTFARPTEIRFEGGVTAIVGPNGSGKTNIVDAIKWVLGSGQARDLRGKTMAEVIYVGGERRSRAAFAEVTLVFDNTAGRLPVDYHEVAIKRRVERDGESDYFLNGSRIRRRDLIHMLSSTGLTVDSYAIIGQHDIEEIVVCTPAERRQLLEEAAQVRGVKQRRQEAVQRLTELAANLLRLEDLKSEIEPRLEVLRAQAAAAREASEATARLELLRGSIVWEEWREARDAHRRASSQVQALDRRLAEAREIAQAAETEFQTWRTEIQAAQDRRLARQRNLGRMRLEVAEAEHSLRLTEERAQNTTALAEVARREETDNRSLSAAAEALRGQLTEELEQAMHSLESVPEAPAIPDAPDPTEVQQARRGGEQARRTVAAATSTLAALRTRREFLEEQSTRVESMAQAAEHIPAAEAELDRARKEAAEAEGAVVMLARLRSELEGLDALRPEPTPGLERLCDVVTAEAGYEAALSAVLGPLVDALVARDEAAAAGATPDRQHTVLYPVTAPQSRAGSLFEHVRCQAGYEDVARRLLGHVVVGEDVTLDGVYREPGLVRAGSDPRVALDVRRHELRDRLARLVPHAAQAEVTARRLKDAESSLADLRSRAAGATRAEETARMLAMARAAELAESEKMPELERVANAADEHAAALAKELEASLEAIGEGRAAAHHAELDRARWRDRLDDIRRQLAAVGDDLLRLQAAAEGRAVRVVQANAAAAASTDAMPALTAAAEAARGALTAAEQESPEDEAEMAEGARRLVALEEARIDARLKLGTLEGNLELIGREAELLQARMEEIRTRMPDGVAPEEVPGGKAREREMRTLEKRLEEIGPTNALADNECRELEERYETLHTQLEDIAAARSDLEQLIGKLREEEDSRYEAVFGAVAANFHEYFSQLAPGGRATLKHADGDDGPRSGVEILVQPPRKRLQNVTLLSSGERSLAALALVLALDEVNPSPFTILDEVDAALDDANVGRFGEMLARLGTQRQFLVITHNHVTMSHASTLYGIHLDESGSSHLVSVRLEDIRKPAARAASTAHAS
ncbi:MAG TPA: AAA family ATPase [Candidatus Dormibacteraeota bacterium]|nr:AAA family ATPase [Candidatus Dormibacteraeota bacterium]